MAANGPAVCFSKRNPTHSGRTSNLVLSRKSVPAGKGGFGAVFGIQVQILIEAGRVAVQAISEPEIYHGAGFKLRADARIRVHKALQICLGSRSYQKP